MKIERLLNDTISTMTYNHGLSQPVQALKIKAASLPKEQIVYINQVLVENFEIENPLEFLRVHSDIQLPKPNSKQGELVQIAIQQLSLQCALAQQLQEHIGLPSFIKPMMLDYQTLADHPPAFTSTVLIPIYPLLSQQVITQTYQLAQKALLTLAKHPGSTIEVFELFSAKNIETLQKWVPSGKSTTPILRAAHQSKIPLFHLGQGIYQLGTGVRAHLFDKSSVDLDSMIGAKMSQDKLITKKLLQHLGYPTPRGQGVRSIEEAQSVFEKLSAPVVIKPQNADRGEGITLHITSKEDIPSAFQKARTYSKSVIIEEMVPGFCHRIAVTNNKILFVNKRLPKYITGDGQHSISQLIDLMNQQELNKAPYLRKITLVLDDDALAHLLMQKFHPDDVPLLDQRVYLRPTESTAWGGIAEDLTEKIHPDNAQLALRITKALRLNVCGIDLMSQDISKPWHENQGYILEANFSPFMATKTVRGMKILQDFIQPLFKEGARIPHQVFIGGQAAHLAAEKAYKKDLKQKKAAFFIQPKATIDDQQAEIKQMLSARLYDRWYSLLMNPCVESIIIHINTDELIDTGLPIDQIEEVTIVNLEIESQHHDPQIQAMRQKQLLKLFEQHHHQQMSQAEE